MRSRTVAFLKPATSVTLTRGSVGSTSGSLCGLLVLPVHGHALPGQHMSERTFVPKLAVSLHKPSTDLFGLARFKNSMRERARGTRGARTDFEELARNVGEIFRFKIGNKSF